MKERKLYLKYSKLFSCPFLYSEYKSSTQKNNCTKYKLCKDIEKNPGPVIHHVDHYKTIKAPYSQAMSLCALIYNNVRGIRNSDDLKQIMHIGNQLYSTLSRLAGQSFLQLTELPTMLTVFDENYQLEYSETYTGDVHGESTIEGYQYCTSLERAFESLISEQFRSFILIVDCIAVGIIYCADNGYFKVFDSHARDIYGKNHPQGSCVLLQISSIHNLVHYFQGLYGLADLYELKGLQIARMMTNNNVEDLLNTSDKQIQCFKKPCVGIPLYSLCYSMISPCSYWNSNILDAIFHNGLQLENKMDIVDMG